MRILFLTKYPALGSSSRYRVYQFLPYYRQAGFDCTVASFHSEDYVRQLGSTRDWRPKARRPRYLLHRSARRLLCLLRAGQYDLVVVEQEVFPLFPGLFDRLIFGLAKAVVVEFDDATHIYHQHLLDSALLRQLLHSKVSGLMARSTGVIVGNRTLETYARKFNPNVLLAPTSIDTSRYETKRAATFSPAGLSRIGWIGTPLTASYLSGISGVLQDLVRRFDIRLHIIGAPAYRIEGVPVVAVPWNLDSEVEELVSCDLGVMPLTNDAYSRGKSGAKLLQYMGAGLPAVASPVGANREIVVHGRTGFLAQSASDWAQALETLISDPDLRKEMGRAARQRVERCYSLSGVAAGLAQFFESCA
jgi:glycosyltransferase involved in cell wall biosynthesis